MRLMLDKLLSVGGNLSPGQIFWTGGTLSSFLDSAPAYLAFFGAILGGHPASETASFLPAVGTKIAALSVATVLFGAVTYVGNGPNLMVKSIADHEKARSPAFPAYLFTWAVANHASVKPQFSGSFISCRMRFAYNILFAVFFWLSAPWYFLKMSRRPNWRAGFWQRFAFYSARSQEAGRRTASLMAPRRQRWRSEHLRAIDSRAGAAIARIPVCRFHHHHHRHGRVGAQIVAEYPKVFLSI